VIHLYSQHKTGTTLLGKIFRELKIPFEGDPYSKQGPPKDLDCVGIHTVRNPYEVIVSGYLYHLKCHERWCIDKSYVFPTNSIFNGKNYNFDGKSYQKKLKSLQPDDGLMMEIEEMSQYAILAMYNWDYTDPRILNVKLEEFMDDYEQTLRQVLTHLQIKDIDSALRKCARFNIYDKPICQTGFITNTKHDKQRYKKYLKSQHYNRIKKIYPDDLFSKLGYSCEIHSN
jgi:hypothetical protein